MAASQSLPQGFSVYQPALGAQLQFLPAVGTQQLDELIHAYIPGAASTQEKRASVSLDFLEYTQLTGQAFKFYPVFALAAAESPATASPLQDSASSFNVSPVTPSWDWSQASGSSSRSSAARQPRNAGSRHEPTDFSHLPGMQIMTRDGRDVTNSASRGSKTKEQRDHAHLMRVIKACDACRKRKTRCDPSHKKRTVSQAQPQPQSQPKTNKKAKMTPAPSIAQDDFLGASPFNMDSSFTGFEDDLAAQTWEQFMQYPASDPAEDYDFFLDPEGFLSPQSSFTSSSASPLKSLSPTSQESLTVSPSEMLNQELQTSPRQQQQFFDPGTDSYVDFNLYSPESSFSEDEFMIPIQSSRLAGVTPPLDPRRLPPVHPPFDGSEAIEGEPAFEPAGELGPGYAGRHALNPRHLAQALADTQALGLPSEQSLGDSTGQIPGILNPQALGDSSQTLLVSSPQALGDSSGEPPQDSSGHESGYTSSQSLGDSSGSAWNLRSSPRASIEQSMRLLGDTSRYGAQESRQTVNPDPSDLTRLVSTGDAQSNAPYLIAESSGNVLHEEPDSGVAGRGRNAAHFSLATLGTTPSAATATLAGARATGVHVAYLSSNGVTTVPDTSMDANGVPGTVAYASTPMVTSSVGGTVATSAASAPRASLDVAISQPDRVETAASAADSTASTSHQETMDDGFVAEKEMRSRSDQASWAEALTDALIVPDLQDTVAGGSYATVAPLSSLVAIVAVLSLMLATMDIRGTASVYALVMITMMVSATVTRYYATKAVVFKTEPAPADPAFNNGKGKGQVKMATRDHVAALRCRASHLLNSQSKVASVNGRLMGF